jgi:hypothetical protein
MYIESSEDSMKSNSAVPGGLLKIKPTRPNTFGCFAASAFCFLWCAHFVAHQGDRQRVDELRSRTLGKSIASDRCREPKHVGVGFLFDGLA